MTDLDLLGRLAERPADRNDVRRMRHLHVRYTGCIRMNVVAFIHALSKDDRRPPIAQEHKAAQSYSAARYSAYDWRSAGGECFGWDV